MPVNLVKAAIRSRPLKAEGVEQVLEINKDENQVILGHEKSFTFDYVFDDSTSNEQLYDECISNIVDEFVKGHSGTVLAYGQTGSGKTYTMGTNYCEDNQNFKAEIGVIPRVLKHIFERYVENWKIEVSFLEIYNELIYDILGSKRQKVQLQEKKNFVNLKNLSSNSVSNLEESLNYLEKGSIARTTGSTAQNANSSRSHAIFIINLTIEMNKSYKLYLVDLAGSEGIGKSQTVGERQREGININKGLLSLGKVLTALSNKNSVHIPYRDSVLTRMLKESLNGVSNTLMIACVNPDIDYVAQTVDTLRYASCAINIPSVNLQHTSFLKEHNQFRSKLDKIPPTPALFQRCGSLPVQSHVTSTPAFYGNSSQPFCPLSALKPTTAFIAPKPAKQKLLKETDFTGLLSPLAKRVHGMLEQSVFKKLDYMETVQRPSLYKESNIPDHSVVAKRKKLVREATNELNTTFSPVKDHMSPIEDCEPMSKLNLTFSPDDTARRNSRLNETFSPEKVTVIEQNENPIDKENVIRNKQSDQIVQMEDFYSPLVKKVQTLMEATIYPKIEKYFQSNYGVNEPKQKRSSPRLNARVVPQLSDVTNHHVNFAKAHGDNILNIINNGSPKNLKSLPCIGEKTAQIIITHRQMKGPIRHLLDLKTVVPQKSLMLRFLKANCLDMLIDYRF